ncbi:MAG: hypothetical protein WC877_03300 [Dehalococcoidales bacterium]|jgi:hypothetical protein|nr:hypothetical protein [Candidatus Neomarinimicrobiota bacterium]
MNEKKNEKSNKNLYLPNWIIEKMDAEAGRYGGPGVMTATAINLLCNLSNEKKIEALKAYRQEEINKLFSPNQALGQADAVVGEAEADTLKRKQNRHPRRLKSS